MKRLGMMIFFTLLFAGVLAVYIYFEHMAFEDRTVLLAEREQNFRLIPLEDGDVIREMKLFTADQKAPVCVLEKQESGWWMTSPVRYPADPLLVGGMATALTVTEKVRNIKRERGWEEYGLDKPKVRVGIRTAKKPELQELWFGDQSQTANLMYARWKSSDKDVFLIPIELKAAFSQSLYSLRSKKIFEPVAEPATRVRIRTFKGEYEISMHKGKWFWVEPIPILGEFVPAADMQTFQDVADQLHVKEFLDDPFLNPAHLGLDVGSPSITIATGTKENEKSQVLWIGSEVPGREAYHAKRKDRDTIFLISSTNVNKVFSKIEAMAAALLPKTDPGLGADLDALKASLAAETPKPEPVSALPAADPSAGTLPEKS